MTTPDTPALKPCFFISPIGSDDSEVRRKANRALKHLVRPALEECGYRADRADEMDSPGSITSQVIERVLEDELVVADLTGSNPNVFYEVALRHAVAKPMVLVAEKDQRIPFDLTDQRVVFYVMDVDTIEDAKVDLVKKVKAAVAPDAKTATPIGRAVYLRGMDSSGDPTERALAEVLKRLSGIERQVNKAATKVDQNRGGLVLSRPLMDHIAESVGSAYFGNSGEELENQIDTALIPYGATIATLPGDALNYLLERIAEVVKRNPTSSGEASKTP